MWTITALWFFGVVTGIGVGIRWAEHRQHTKESHPSTSTNSGIVEILLNKLRELIAAWMADDNECDASVFIMFEELDEFIAQNFTSA